MIFLQGLFVVALFVVGPQGLRVVVSLSVCHGWGRHDRNEGHVFVVIVIAGLELAFDFRTRAFMFTYLRRVIPQVQSSHTHLYY